MPRPRWLSLVVVLLLGLLFGAAAEADEVIERFDVEILVQPDGAIEVTETIRITVLGVAVRRGIEREIPLSRANGRRASFELLEVRRDAVAEPYRETRAHDRVQIRIGSADGLLPIPSVQTYTLRYRSDGQLRGFRAFDELYWNVTGHESPFAIERASVAIRLPGEFEFVQDAAYTGRPGARGEKFRVTERAAGQYAAETTATLPPGHGFTVALGWPKGAIAGVVEVAERPLVFGLPALLVTLPAALGASLVVILAVRIGCCGGPRAGVDHPRFRPPEDLSPAACRYLVTRRVDDRSLTACIVGLASKGALKIVDWGGRPRFELVSTGPGEGLHPDEAVVRRWLFGDDGEPVALGGNDDRVSAARGALAGTVEKAHGRSAYRPTDAVSAIGMMVIIAIVGAAVVAPYRAMPELAMGAIGILAGIAAAAVFVVRRLLQPTRPVATVVSRGILRDNPELVGTLLVVGLTACLVGLHLAVDLDRHGHLVELAVAGIFGIPLGGLVASFVHELVVPTALGRERLEAIDGLALYLSVAEADRLEMLHPPDRTAEHFEQLLPYAIALGHARSWTRQFTHALATTRPEWYEPADSGQDDTWGWLETDHLERDVRATRPTPAPRRDGAGGGGWGGSSGDWSSPGSAGGGSSGGGGGGGGTRGW